MKIKISSSQDKVSGLAQSYILSSVSERFIVYLVEIVFVLSLSEIFASLVGIKPYLFNAMVSYRLGELSFSYLLSRGFIINTVIFITIVFIYFLIEEVSGYGVGRILANKYIINRYVQSKDSRIVAHVIRAALKSFPLFVFVDSILIFRRNNRKFLQRASDAALGFLVVKKKISASKKYENLMDYLKLYVLGASIMYYSLFISTFIISWMIVPMVTSTSGTGQSRVNFLNEFVSILSQNIPFDFYLVTGGMTLSFGSLLFLVESLDSENAILVSILKSPSSVNFINGVLPQFIPESLGYVFGLSAAFSIASLIINFVQSMINKQASLSFANASARNLKYALASVSISLVLLVFAACIEAYLFLLG